MPVTKTAKRALRSSKRKEAVNAKRRTRLEIALRKAVKSPSKETIKTAISLADRSAKTKIIHKNKAARIKSKLSKLIKPTVKKAKAKTSKKG